MREIVALIRKEKIPTKHHAALIDACLEGDWTANNAGRPNSIGSNGSVWWFQVSGRAESQRQQAKRESLKWKYRDKSIDEFSKEMVADMRKLIKAVDKVAEFAELIENARLRGSLVTVSDDLITSVDTLRTNILESQVASIVPNLTALPGGKP